MTQQGNMGGLQPYNETEYGWALDTGYKFARYEYQIAKFEAREANESETIRKCNDIIMSLNRALLGKGFQQFLPSYHQAHGDSLHKRLVYLFWWNYKSFSHAVYYSIGTAIGQRHLGFTSRAVRERIKQITVWFRVLDSRGQKEMLFNLTEAGRNETVLPKEPLTAKALLMAMFEPRVILFVSTDPTDTDHVRGGREYREIDHALASSKFGSSFVLEPVLSCRASDLGSNICVVRPAYIHFSGHGNVSGLVFENENNSSAVVNHNPLAYFLRVVQEEADFRLGGAFLNACYSAENGQILANTTGALVAIQSSISDEDAITFAKHFYKALGDGSTYESSFKLSIADLGLMNGIAEDLHPQFFKAQAAPITVDERDREMPEFDSPLDVLRRTSKRDPESSIGPVKGGAAPPPLYFPDPAMLVTHLSDKCFTELLFFPCGDYFVTLNKEGIVSTWDSHNGGHVSNLLLNGPTSAIAFCPDKIFLACAVKQQGIFLASWNCDDMKTGRLGDTKLLTMFPSEQIVVGIALSCGAERLAVVSRKGMERTYRIASSSGKVLRRESLTAGGDAFCDRVAMSDDGKALAYARAPNLLAAEFPSPLPKKVGPVERTSSMFSGIRDVVALPNMQAFIIAGKSCDRMHAIPSQIQRKPLITPERGRTFTHVVASSDGSFVMVAYEEGIERIQLNSPKVATGRNGGPATANLEDQPSSRRGSVHSPQPPPIRKLFMAQKLVTCMALSPNNDRLIAASSSGLVKVWNLQLEHATPTILMGREEIHEGELWATSPSSSLPPVKGTEFLSASPSRVKGKIRSSSRGVKKVVRSSSSSLVKELVHPSSSSPVKKGAPSASSSPIKEGGLFSSCSPLRNKMPSYHSSPVKEAPSQETLPVKAVEKLTIQFPDTQFSDTQSPDARFSYVDEI